MRILLWHVHGSWTTAFVQGSHTYLLPVLPDRGPDGLGRARTWDWPAAAVEVAPEEARTTDIDLVVLQRPQELATLARQWTGRRPGRDLPAVYLEHNTPEGPVNSMVHPVAADPTMTVAHVTHFNDLFWDCGRAPTTVIEHGIVDPGYRYTGTSAHAVAVINEPDRRGRTTGTDVLQDMRTTVPIDLFGMGTEALGGAALGQDDLHTAMARRRVYFHPNRWTSLGLSLIEAMHLGMPVVAVGAAETPEAVPPEAGIVSPRRETLRAGLRRLTHDPDEAAARGACARQVALSRWGLDRFLRDWDELMEEAVG